MHTAAVSACLAVAAWLATGTASAQVPAEDEVREVRGRIAESIDEVPSQATHEFRIVTVIDDDDEVKAPPTRGIPARTRAVLRRAYQAIKAAGDAEGRDDEDEGFVDAAGSLYAAAIRAAQAGEPGRAARLARAAITLARTPELLAEVEGEEVGASTGEGQAFEGRMILVPQLGGEEGEGRVRIEFRRQGEAAEGEEGHIESRELKLGPLRLELRGAEQAEEAARADDAGPVVGVGLALGQDDEGNFGVLDVLPGSPAAEEGSIRKGDQLVGIKTGDEVESFEGKDLAEVVGMIRGEAGTEVRLLVRHEGDDEDTAVTLTRKPLQVPAAGADDAKPSEKPDGDQPDDHDDHDDD
jgi:hypothetical protein